MDAGVLLSGAWASQYVGIPYEEADCFDLLARVYRECAGIELPVASVDHGPQHVANAVRTIEQQRDAWVRVVAPAPLDVLLLRILGHECHVGVYVSRGFFLHAPRPHHASRLERVTRWQRRIAGIYRHPTRCES